MRVRVCVPAAAALTLTLALAGCGDKRQLTTTQACLRKAGALRQAHAPKDLARGQRLDARRLGDTGLVGEVIATRNRRFIALANQALRKERKVLRLQSLWIAPEGTDPRALLRRCARSA